MPHHKSAKKRLRQSQEQRLRNRGLRTTFRKTLKTAQDDPARTAEAVSAADVAARHGIIHRNKAARVKSRLMKRQAAPKTGT